MIKIKNFKLLFNKQNLFNINNKKRKFSFQIFLLLILLLLVKKLENQKKIKVCLCTLGKNENKYIKEFVEYYKNYKVDKIFLYDNNDIDGEKFEDILKKYIKKGYIEIINWRGIEKVQFQIMNNCYQNNYDKFEWLIFYDIDEFIFLKNYTNIKKYLNQPKFFNCGKIELNWIHRVNENSIHYENRPLKERFRDIELNIIKNNSYYLPQVKSILKGHIPNIHIECLHILTSNLSSCDGYGRSSQKIGFRSLRPDYEDYYINHYFGKSIEEFIEKSKKGSAAIGKNKISIMAKIIRYFQIYKITKEKIDIFEKEIGINLSSYRNKIQT